MEEATGLKHFRWPAIQGRGSGSGHESDQSSDMRITRIPIGPDPVTGEMRFRYKCHCGSTFKSVGQLRAHSRYKHKSGRACQCPCVSPLSPSLPRCCCALTTAVRSLLCPSRV